jgi:hypothetical protein
MSLRSVFETAIKPELNAIYVEPPFMMEGGWDCGWFCREHALHTYVLASMLHQSASIRTGDFVIHSKEGTGITSINSGADHAWCEIEGIMPVDLSMSFVHFKGRFPHLPIVYGAQPTGKFSIRCLSSESDLANDLGIETFAISYIERQTSRPGVEELLRFPYRFLHPPPEGLKKWTEIHGSEIFSKTSAHLYRLAKAHMKPLSPSRSSKQIIKFIKSHYPNATNEILSMIHARAKVSN